MKSTGLADSPFFPEKKPKIVKLSSNHAIMVADHQNRKKSSYQNNIIKEIRKMISEIGKESSTYRISKGEKKLLLSIIYELRMNGIKTSENQMIRIGLNYVVQDYLKSKGNSMLLKTL